MGPFSAKSNRNIEWGGTTIPHYVIAHPTEGLRIIIGEKCVKPDPKIVEILHEKLPGVFLGLAGSFFLILSGFQHDDGGTMPLIGGLIILSAVVWVAICHFKRVAEPAIMPRMMKIHHSIIAQVNSRWDNTSGLKLLVDMTKVDLNGEEIVSPKGLDAYDLVDERDRRLGPLAPWLEFAPKKHCPPKKAFQRVMDLVCRFNKDRTDAFARNIATLENLAEQQKKFPLSDLSKEVFPLELENASIVAHAIAVGNLDIYDIPDRI